MTPPARRDGTPENTGGASRREEQSRRDRERHGAQRAADIYVSQARPARHQHVDRDDKPRRRGGGEDGVRLQKVLAQAGVASRRMSEKLIEQGRVEVDGKIVTRQGVRVDPDTQVIRVDGSRVIVDESKQYFALNKPRGVQSTLHDDQGRPCIGDIIDERLASGQRLFHVGRLDAQTEGLILLTNDGELANRLMHPRYNVTKTYLATVVGEMDKADCSRLMKEGVELEDGPARADFAQIIDVWQGRTIVRVELHEGRKHIVRRMLKAAGFPVERLVRTKIHTVQLGEQTPGALRALNRAELTSLYNAVGL